MVDKFCCVNGGACILIQGTGRVIMGTTPVSAGATAGPIAFPWAIWRIPKYSPPVPTPVMVTFLAQPPSLTTAETVASDKSVFLERAEVAFD
jgi:hypothetical protein